MISVAKRFHGNGKIFKKDYKLLGVGRSASVYRIKETHQAVKVFFPSFAHLAEEEAAVYRVLQGSPYFPALYQVGADYLVMDYIEGHTLFECLCKGIPITEEQIQEVDQALEVARERGLNPSDIHLRNIIVTTDGKVKLIDVARFRQTKNCTQWDDLKNAFYRFYRLPYFPKKIPAFILNWTAALYKRKLLG